MKEKIKVYVSIPMTGRMPEDVTNHIAVIAGFLNTLGYETIIPQLAGVEKPGVPLPKNLHELNAEIYAACRNGVRTADIVFADLTGADEVSIGCVREIGWGHDWGKRVVVAKGYDNPHRHAFILAEADEVLDTRWQAFEYFREYIKEASRSCPSVDSRDSSPRASR